MINILLGLLAFLLGLLTYMLGLFIVLCVVSINTKKEKNFDE